MARTTINSQGVPVGTITASDLSYPLTTFSSTGIDDNASATVMTVAGGSSGNNSIIQSVNSNYNAGFYGSSANFGFEISDGGVGGKTVRIKNNNTEIFAHNQVQNIIDMSNASSVTVAGFTSTGIDDNATSTAITISSSENVTFVGEIDAGESRFFKPSTFWSGSTAFFGHNYGSMATQGNYDLHLTANGYRNSSGTWTSLAVNSKTGASQIALDPDGEIGFNTDATKANGDSHVVTRRMTIDSNGNVGIGVPNPDALLHVKVTEGSTGETDPIARFERFTTSDNHYLDITLDNSTNMVGFQSTGTSNGGFTFGGASSDLVTITSAGNVGIGAPAASGINAPLDVDKAPVYDHCVANFGEFVNLSGYQRGVVNINGRVNNTDYDAGLSFVRRTSANNNWVNSIIAQDASGNLYFGTGGVAANASTERMRIETGGNVGIGTNDPTEKLEVSGGSLLVDAFAAGNEEGIFFRRGFTSTNKYNMSILAYDHNNGGVSADGLSINSSEAISFSTGSNNRNEVMRIAGNGNVTHENGAFFHGETSHDTASITGSSSSSITTSGIATTNSTFIPVANTGSTWIITVRVHYNSSVYYHEAIGSCVMSGVFWNNSGTSWHDVLLNHHNAASVPVQIQFDTASANNVQQLRIKTVSGSFAFTGGVYFTGVRLY